MLSQASNLPQNPNSTPLNPRPSTTKSPIDRSESSKLEAKLSLMRENLKNRKESIQKSELTAANELPLQLGMMIMPTANAIEQSASKTVSSRSQVPLIKEEENNPDQKLLIETLQFFESKKKKADHRKQLSLDVGHSNNSSKLDNSISRIGDKEDTVTPKGSVLNGGRAEQYNLRNCVTSHKELGGLDNHSRIDLIGVRDRLRGETEKKTEVKDKFEENNLLLKQIMKRIEKIEEVNASQKHITTQLKEENNLLQEQIHGLRKDTLQNQRVRL